MNRREIIVGGAAAVCSGCNSFSPRYSFSYRVLVTLRIADRTVEGSSIFKNTWVDSGLLKGIDAVEPFSPRAWGQAVIVPMESGGPIFALLRRPLGSENGGFDLTPDRYLTPYLKPELRTRRARESGALFAAISKFRGTFPVPKEHWPILVRFENLNDRATGQIVGSERRGSSRGVIIEKVSISTTDAPPSTGIDKILPWLNDMKVMQIARSDVSWQQNLARGNFIAEGVSA